MDTNERSKIIMRPNDITKFILMHTGLSIDEGQIIWWEVKGLLGEVPRTEKNRRNYTATNASLCLVVVICKVLRWGLVDIEKLIKQKDKDLKDKFITECHTLVDKFMPKIKEVLKELDSIII